MRKGESIFKRKDGRYEARYIKERKADGKAVYGYAYGHSYTEAKNKRLDAVKSLNQKLEKAVAQRVSFIEAAELWLSKKSGTVKTSTLAKYSEILNNRLYPSFSTMLLSEIDDIYVNQFKMNLVEQKLSASYISSIMGALISICRSVEKNGHELNFSIKDLKPHCERQELQVLSPEKQDILTRHLLNSATLTDIGILVSLYMGLRIGEVCALKWEDVSLTDGSLRVSRTIQRLPSKEGNKKTELIISEPKSSKSKRTLPIPGFLIDVLRKNTSSSGCYLLSGTIKPIEPRTMQNKFKRALNECRIEHMNFHILRHTFATRCVELGVDVKALSEMLGHSGVKITLDRYVHPTQEQKKSYINKVAEAFYSSSKS